ncbi:MAG TPA: glutamate racemase [Alphaproteobacteria bacterium]|nr:glutamate racemase [Alphaproteobacteria bacterium]
MTQPAALLSGPIGVFDSGHGGLTILRALVDRLPGRSFVYLGDHAHAPYGRRDADDIYRLTVEAIDWLFRQGCPLVVVACNTAAAVALRRLQHDWLPVHHPHRRVLGVLVPMVEAITDVPWHVETPAPGLSPAPRTVGIFATAATVASRAYPAEIGKRAPHIRVVQQACPDLVPLIEAGAAREAIRPVVHGYVAALKAQLGGAEPDSVVLGCTHYPLVADLFGEVLAPAVRIISQPVIAADSLAGYLDRHPEFAAPAGPAPLRFHTSGDPAAVNASAERFVAADWIFRSA